MQENHDFRKNNLSNMIILFYESKLKTLQTISKQYLINAQINYTCDYMSKLGDMSGGGV
jgi:hypothetical protein